MKTKEFIEKANKLGYKVEQGRMGTSIYNEMSCYTMAIVSENFENRVNIHYASNELFDLIVSYAKTPVKERKSAKKYRVKVLPYSEGYLNVRYGYGNTVTNHYLISDAKEQADYKTKFTEDEIEELKKRPDLAIDWDRVMLEEAN